MDGGGEEEGKDEGSVCGVGSGEEMMRAMTMCRSVLGGWCIVRAPSRRTGWEASSSQIGKQ